ncbi:MAG: hypothetical protein ACK5Y6_10720 [Pseudomonadota bacterium]|jgi:hypothetical protein
MPILNPNLKTRTGLRNSFIAKFDEVATRVSSTGAEDTFETSYKKQLALFDKPLFTKMIAVITNYRTHLLAAVMVLSHNAQAIDIPKGSELVTVRVEAKPEPVRAVGIVFGSRSSHQVQETEITKIGDKLYQIAFAVPRAMLNEDSVASAIAFDEADVVSYANVTPALADQAREMIAAIPECPAEDPSRIAALNSPGILQQLVDVRNERMNIVRLKISRLMDQDFLAKLRKFEEAFGLERSSELSADLPPEELIDRLSRIQHAVRKYKTYQSQPR